MLVSMQLPSCEHLYKNSLRRSGLSPFLAEHFTPKDYQAPARNTRLEQTLELSGTIWNSWLQNDEVQLCFNEVHQLHETNPTGLFSGCDSESVVVFQMHISKINPQSEELHTFCCKGRRLTMTVSGIARAEPNLAIAFELLTFFQVSTKKFSGNQSTKQGNWCRKTIIVNTGPTGSTLELAPRACGLNTLLRVPSRNNSLGLLIRCRGSGPVTGPRLSGSTKKTCSTPLTRRSTCDKDTHKTSTSRIMVDTCVEKNQLSGITCWVTDRLLMQAWIWGYRIC